MAIKNISKPGKAIRDQLVGPAALDKDGNVVGLKVGSDHEGEVLGFDEHGDPVILPGLPAAEAADVGQVVGVNASGEYELMTVSGTITDTNVSSLITLNTTNFEFVAIDAHKLNDIVIVNFRVKVINANSGSALQLFTYDNSIKPTVQCASLIYFDPQAYSVEPALMTTSGGSSYVYHQTFAVDRAILGSFVYHL